MVIYIYDLKKRILEKQKNFLSMVFVEGCYGFEYDIPLVY